MKKVNNWLDDHQAIINEILYIQLVRVKDRLLKMIPMSFGGDWTQEKLDRLQKYLREYVKILNKHRNYLEFDYIDAFAGTGFYDNLKQEQSSDELLFQELLEEEPTQYRDGSARIALQIEPSFSRYIFIEKDKNRFIQLQTQLKHDFPAKADRILFVNADANQYIVELCSKTNWNKRRAVLFLDPFGMQVTWETIKAIAATEAIDLWYLFPFGMGVIRMLRNDGQISDNWQRKLNAIFGEHGWYDAFYRSYVQQDLFGEEHQKMEKADFTAVSRYFVERLKTIFPGVAENPLPLRNSKNSPLYLLCFAASNKRVAEVAVRIAEYILGH